MNPTIEQLEAAIAAANEKLAELKAQAKAEADDSWPKKGDTYFLVDGDGDVVNSQWCSDLFDTSRMNIGNVFRTVAEAEHEIDRHKVLTKLRRLAKESRGAAGKPDWSNTQQDKWRLYYNHACKVWRTVPSIQDQSLNAVYFMSEEAAQDAIETIGADRLMLLLED